ncbi:MAG TPA: hypothetical protein VJM34_04225 [Novosphingobium sp.]|nr:hypothetical protein [Novosphingobium sp.]
MNSEALDRQRARDGLKDILLGSGQMHEALRDERWSAETTLFGGEKVEARNILG